MCRLASVATAVAFATIAFPETVHAAFVPVYADPPGAGFNDASFREPLADNDGASVGEQRRIAFEYALETWDRALAPQVPVRVLAGFDDTLPCTNGAVVLGAGSPIRVRAAFAGAPRSDLFFVAALANQLAGEDLDRNTPDLEVLFNAAVDEGCLGGAGWNYNLVPSGGALDFVATALHEIAHGLGVATRVNAMSGAASSGLTQFERLVFDRRLGRYWDQMSAEQRAISVRSPWTVVWHGSAVASAATEVLAVGAPQLELWAHDASPSFEHRFSEAVGAAHVVETVGARLVASAWQDACEPRTDWRNRVVLMNGAGTCGNPAEAVRAAQRAGVLAVLWRAESDILPPPPLVLDSKANVPVMSLAQGRFDELAAQVRGSRVLNARLSSGSERQPGRSGIGVLLNANTRGVSGISHWDPSVRKKPDEHGSVGLLLEPAASDVAGFSLEDLTLAIVLDVGWGVADCGNGALEPGEVCDNGSANSNVEPGACRLDCRVARCGDGVVDPDEQCDLGRAPDWNDCPTNCGRDINLHPQSESLPVSVGFVADPPIDAGVRPDGGSDAGADGGTWGSLSDANADAGNAPSVPMEDASCRCSLTKYSRGSGFWAYCLVAVAFFLRRRS